MLKTITLNDFDSEVMSAECPILLACIRRRHGYKEQLEIVERIIKRYHPWVEVCLVTEDSIAAFGKKFGINGTPFFVIVDGGKQKGRLLGRADTERMKSFLTTALPYFQGVRP